MMRKFSIIFLLVSAGILSCIKAPDYPIEPTLELVGLTKDTMNQDQFNTDSVIIVLNFTDGDGDVGSNNELNVFVTDLRDNFLSDRFRIPPLNEQPGYNNGISGELRLTLYTTCCIYPNGAPPCEPSTQFSTNKLSYEIYMMDQAGNKSNVVTTPEIVLRCN